MRLLVSTVLIAACSSQPVATPPPPAAGAQNPSPMVETTRAHERIERKPLAGRIYAIESVLEKPVEVMVTKAAAAAGSVELIVHFHGASWLAMQAAEESGRALIVAAVHLGGGGMRYSAAFEDPKVFQTLLDRLAEGNAPIAKIHLTGFSAGYGAIRSILRSDDAVARVHGVLLLDGLHTAYVPEGKVMSDGAVLDDSRLAPFLAFAQRALRDEKRLVITHSEIFPGTFGSTTETTDWLLQKCGLQRVPVVKWGPLGMQQLSETRSGRLAVLGFAGNSAPDHIDHFHAIGHFLRLLLD